MNDKLKRSLTSGLIATAFVSAAYIFLCTQSENAYWGVLGTILYLLQYFIVFSAVSCVQPKSFISPMLGAVNALLLFFMQLNRGTGGGFINFGWDWLLAAAMQTLALYNFIFCLLLILVLLAIKSIRWLIQRHRFHD